MNARQPVFFSPTANPLADAERWEDAQDQRASEYEALEIMAGQILMAAFEAAKPADFYETKPIGDSFRMSIDAMALQSIGDDDEATTAFAELMCSPAAHRFKDAVASFWARHHFREIAGFPKCDLG